MMTRTIASVSGTAAATTMPPRQPSAIRLTIMTIASASRNVRMNWSTAWVMFTDWSVTCVNDIPSGSSEPIAWTSACSDLPSFRPFQPSRMMTPSTRAGSP
jgi:hypothetical protein